MRTVSVLCLASVVYLFAAREKNSGLMWSFEQAGDVRSIITSHARVAQLHNFATEGHYALQVDFEAVEQPQIELSAAAIKPDWRRSGALGLDVTNPSEEPLGFSLTANTSYVDDQDAPVQIATLKSGRAVVVYYVMDAGKKVATKVLVRNAP